MRTREELPGRSPIAPGQARLTSELFADGLPEKKLQLIGMSILLILLSPGPRCYIGSPSKGVMTRSQNLALFIEHHSFVSCFEPTKVEEALQDPYWINALHEELNNFTRNEVWTLEIAKRCKSHWNKVGVPQ